MAVDNATPPAAPGADPESLVRRVQELTARLEQIASPEDRMHAEELLGAVIELYGEGLARIFEALEDGGEASAPIRERLAGDGVVASLMLIHGLFPVDLEARVAEALDSVRPYMESHGGDVELIGIENGVARIRLEGSCEGCPASASTLELAIKQALDEAAPDLEGLAVEGAAGSPSPIGDGATELPVVQVAPGRAGVQPAWYELERLPVAEDGDLAALEIEGIRLLVARIEGSLLAYRDACAGCGGGLAAGELSDGVLACPACERRYYLPRAGRSLGDERLQLEPVPLLEGAGGAKVALAA
jgi:Fe-S cluster biogenesis protein NfuA/nitrite reductase/ring-hydroxylating ferredoxin subunit